MTNETDDNSHADRSTYKNLVTANRDAAAAAERVHDAEVAYELAKAPPSDKLVAHAVDPEQLCGTCLHRRKHHLADQQCTLRDVHTGQQCGCTTFLDGPPDIEDPTNDPRVDQLPAVTTSMDPAQFKAWLDSAGEMFVVYLPGQKSFVIKVPDEHNAFFVAMMQQVRFALGTEVKAVRMIPMQGPPAEAEGTAYAPGADPQQYEQFAKAPPEEFAPGEPRKVKCAGSGKPPRKGTERFRNVKPTPDNPGYNAGRGACESCTGQYKLTDAGNVRVHYTRA